MVGVACTPPRGLVRGEVGGELGGDDDEATRPELLLAERAVEARRRPRLTRRVEAGGGGGRSA